MILLVLVFHGFQPSWFIGCVDKERSAAWTTLVASLSASVIWRIATRRIWPGWSRRDCGGADRLGRHYTEDELCQVLPGVFATIAGGET